MRGVLAQLTPEAGEPGQDALRQQAPRGGRARHEPHRARARHAQDPERDRRRELPRTRTGRMRGATVTAWSQASSRPRRRPRPPSSTPPNWARSEVGEARRRPRDRPAGDGPAHQGRAEPARGDDRARRAARCSAQVAQVTAEITASERARCRWSAGSMADVIQPARRGPAAAAEEQARGEAAAIIERGRAEAESAARAGRVVPAGRRGVARRCSPAAAHAARGRAGRRLPPRGEDPEAVRAALRRGAGRGARPQGDPARASRSARRPAWISAAWPSASRLNGAKCDDLQHGRNRWVATMAAPSNCSRPAGREERRSRRKSSALGVAQARERPAPASSSPSSEGTWK